MPSLSLPEPSRGNRWGRRSLLGLALTLPLLLPALSGFAQPVPAPGPVPQAPPPAMPPQRSPISPENPGPKPLGITPYSIGQPTDEEQLYLEYLNRMRSNPTAEGQRLANTTDPNVLGAYAFFHVDLSLLQAELATNPPVPPLAMNAHLLNAARWHSGDMFTNQYQGHLQTDGANVLTPDQRMAANGYSISDWGENVYAYADSVFHGHAGFAVDWGGTNAGGMQEPPGHRDNMLSPLFREVGMGVVDGSNGSVGPQLVTQDFGAQPSSPAFLTGVVYFDLNGNGFYDPGEGIGGVTVNTPGSTYFAVTADSGGYAIPVTANGSYTLTFTGPGLSNQTAVAVSGMQNVKADLIPPYSPPMISGPNPAVLNQANTYTFTPVVAATGYQWQQASLNPFDRVEGAENGLSNVTVAASPGYSVISSDFAASGTYSFHLEHATAMDQSLTLNPVLQVGPASQLTFDELLDFAFSNEVAQAQISADSGQTWTTVWSKAGNDGNSPVDAGFVPQAIPLGTYAGQALQVRFVFGFSPGEYFLPGSGIGLYLDDIAVSNAGVLGNALTGNVTSDNSFTFTPAGGSNYLLQVRAQINTRLLPWGPALQVSVAGAASGPQIQLADSPTISGNQIQIDFSVTNYRSGMSFQLLRSTSLPGAWAPDNSAMLQTITPGSQFRFITSSGAAQNLFFKVGGS